MTNVQTDCRCPACDRGEPFTRDHFARWGRMLKLDDGSSWIIEEFQLDFAEDVFAFTLAEVPAECWLLVPEGNGKTTLIAGLALYYLEHYRDASIPIAAASREQAETVYKQAEGFIVRTERLHEGVPNVFDQKKGKRPKDVPRFEAQNGFRRVIFNLGGLMQIRAADEATGDGIIPRGLMIIDEPHRQRDLGLYRLWLGKGEKNGTPLAAISTAGEPGSEFEEAREEMRRGDVVERDGCFVRSWTESSVLHEWAVPEDGDVDDLDLVASANPLRSITAACLGRKRRKKSWNLTHWRRFTCNLATRSVSAAITEAEWYARVSRERIPAGEPIALGLDVAWKWDTTALVPLWVREREFRLFGPAVILEPPQDEGSLDPNLIERALFDTHRVNPIHTVVMDTSRAEQLAHWIADSLGATVIDRQQTNPLASLDYQRFTEALRMGWLWHSGDPGLTRHVLNATARTLPDGGTRFDRPKASRYGGQAQQRARWVDALSAGSMVHTTMTADFYDDEEEQEPLVSWL